MEYVEINGKVYRYAGNVKDERCWIYMRTNLGEIEDVKFI